MKITLEFAKSKGACADGLAWFEAKFGLEADYQLTLDTLADERKIDWARWLLKAIGPTAEVLTIDGPTNTRAHIIAAGHLVIAGNLAVSGSVQAGEGIEAGLSISCNGIVFSSLRIFAGVCGWRIPTADEQRIVCTQVNGIVAHGTLQLAPAATPEPTVTP